MEIRLLKAHLRIAFAFALGVRVGELIIASVIHRAPVVESPLPTPDPAPILRYHVDPDPDLDLPFSPDEPAGGSVLV